MHTLTHANIPEMSFFKALVKWVLHALFFCYLQVRGDVLSKFIETKTLEESLKL